MSYRKKVKERYLRRILINIFNVLKFSNFNLDFQSKIIIVWSISTLISLFLPWWTKIGENISWNSFSLMWWNIWFISLLLIFIIIFVMTTNDIKEKINLASNLSFKKYLVAILWWLFMILIWIIYISLIFWLTTFFENIEIWNWIILYISSWILIFIWWILKRSNFIKKEYESFINEPTYNNEDVKNSDSNMKLPF